MSVAARQLGAGGPIVGPVGIGAMSFAGFYGPTTEADSYAVLDAALDAGMVHVDTANVYGMGRSEEVIGAFLKARGADARDRLVIATKAGISSDPDTGARCYDNSAAHLEAELDKSLARLGVEAVDLFYVHRRDAERPIEEVTEVLAGLVRKGKTRGFGFSEIAPTSLRRAAAVHPVAAVQSEYSLSTRFPDLGLVQTCAELGTALVAFSPVGRSLLTDRPMSRDEAAASGFLKYNPRFLEPNLGRNVAATAGFRALATARGEAAAALAIAWVLSRGEHVIAIPGTRTAAHAAELFRGAELAGDAGLIAEIEAALPVGWAHGDRYSEDQWIGPERYC